MADFKPIVLKSAFNIRNVIANLHIAANKKVGKSGYVIQNTAVTTESDDLNTAKFYGAGQHEIIAFAAKGQAERDKAFDVIKTYVQWFLGPDIASKIKADQLDPVEAEDDQMQVKADAEKKEKEDKEKKENKEKEDKEKENDEDNEETTSESLLSLLPSFKVFLTEADDKKDERVDSNIKGYSLGFQLNIDGMKQHPIIDTMKNLARYAKEWIGNIEISSQGLGSALWGGSGDKRSMKLKEFVQHIDIEKVFSKYQEMFGKKFKTDDPLTTHTILSTNVIKKTIKKFKPPSDADKLLKKAEYAICTRVTKRDKAYSLIQKDVLAKLMCDALEASLNKDTIRGQLKKIAAAFKDKIKKNNIILINNYSTALKDKNKSKYEKSDDSGAENGEVQDESINNRFHKKIINEQNGGTVEDLPKKKEGVGESHLSEENIKEMSKEFRAALEKEILPVIQAAIDKKEYSKLKEKPPSEESIFKDYVDIQVKPLEDIQNDDVSQVKGAKTDVVKLVKDKIKGDVKNVYGFVVSIKAAVNFIADESGMTANESKQFSEYLTNSIVKYLFEADEGKDGKEEKTHEEKRYKSKPVQIKTINDIADVICKKNNVSRILDTQVITDPAIYKLKRHKKLHIDLDKYNMKYIKIVTELINKIIEDMDSTVAQAGVKTILSPFKEIGVDISKDIKDAIKTAKSGGTPSGSVDEESIKKQITAEKIPQLSKNLNTFIKGLEKAIDALSSKREDKKSAGDGDAASRIETVINDFKSYLREIKDIQNLFANKLKDANVKDKEETGNGNLMAITSDIMKDAGPVSQVVVVPFKFDFKSEKKVDRTEYDFYIIPIEGGEIMDKDDGGK